MIIKLFLSIISIIFALLMIYITKINLKKKNLSNLDFIIWNIVWVIIIFLSIRPKFIDEYIIDKYNLDIFYISTIIGFLMLIIIYFFNFIKIKILEKKINTLIRAESLKKIFDKIK